jgi:hypothetical protein
MINLQIILLQGKEKYDIRFKIKKLFLYYRRDTWQKNLRVGRENNINFKSKLFRDHQKLDIWNDVRRMFTDGSDFCMISTTAHITDQSII